MTLLTGDNLTRIRREGLGLVLLILVQAFCAVFFLTDAMSDFADAGRFAFKDWHLIVETVAALGLVVGIVFELRYLFRLLRRKAHVERGLSIAAGALHEVMEAYFDTWALTPAERDVATFALKGMSNTEIAELRGSAEGTVKAHLNGIYRKAGVSGRGALLSLLVEDLMQSPLLDGAARGPGPSKR
ncbi:regulatory protein, luxR family [Lutimaribacter saemankumensis]|uniref:Regulatory protein, luxR family n=2 Tax=Lutimaribacter saemankumensis TaxID=490829 RepID=A0A1G8RYG3_9RHOB|nr:regulatory protein, luxR family [Lutimaribacter saemankumensis]